MYRLTGTLSTEAVTAASAADGGRLLTGLAVPWGLQGGATSHGRMTVDRGAVSLPSDLRRVKLLRDHDRTSPVGYLQAAEDTDQGLVLTFRVASTPSGDAALLEATEGVRDGLSVEVDDPVIRNGHLTGGRLVAVAQCAVPAWDDARMALTATEATDPPPDTPAPSSAPGHPAPVPGADPESPEDDDDDDDDDDTPPTADPATPSEDPMEPSTTVTAARVSPAVATPRPAPVTFQAAMTAMAAYSRGEIDERGVRAALTDIVPANDVGEGLLRPAWIGEVWNATYAARDLIDSITHLALPATGTKVVGFGWGTRPIGGPYSGNKADIPSGPASTKALEAPVLRWAGGNDIDRIYIDRGDAGFRAAYFSALAQDYALDTEAAVVEALLTDATPGTAGLADLPSVLVDAGMQLATIGATLSFVACAADVYTGAFAITSQEAPWLLGSASADIRGVGVTIGGIRVFSDPNLPAATVLAGDRRAATFWEATPPIRLETVNIPQGGVDWALMGYYAHLTNDARALLAYDLTPPPAP